MVNLDGKVEVRFKYESKLVMSLTSIKKINKFKCKLLNLIPIKKSKY